MKCENCGNEVREGAKFCSKCGSNILEQQEDHSGKHNVHETKTEKRCVNCGNVLREESKFCPKCGSSTLEQKEDVSTLKDEEKSKLSLDEAKKLYPEWYQERVVEGRPKKKGTWVCNEALYEWWKSIATAVCVW